MKNYFTILRLAENAGSDEIKQAYRKLAKQYHPDINKSPEAHEKFCEISEAYEFLMNHWPINGFRNTGPSNQQSADFEQSDDFINFQHEAQERARRHAKMRYEKFKKQHEAFQESGINDAVLLLTVFSRIISFLLFLFLVFTPLVLTFVIHWTWIFSIFLMWPFAVGLGWYYYDNRKNYFVPGNFYYTFNKIRTLFTEVTPTLQECYFCKGKAADSRPFKIELYKLKDIKLKSEGVRQHNVNYISETFEVVIPRSRKAFIIHTVNSVLKILCIATTMIFLKISSIVWCTIFGFLLASLLSGIILMLFRTRSNTSYIFSVGFICRLVIWMVSISLASRFYADPYDIVSTDGIQFVLVAIVIFDSFIMQLLNIILGKTAGRIILCHYKPLKEKINEGYSVYNDIPVISVLYPLFKWIIG